MVLRGTLYCSAARLKPSSPFKKALKYSGRACSRSNLCLVGYMGTSYCMHSVTKSATASQLRPCRPHRHCKGCFISCLSLACGLWPCARSVAQSKVSENFASEKRSVARFVQHSESPSKEAGLKHIQKDPLYFHLLGFRQFLGLPRGHKQSHRCVRLYGRLSVRANT
jgi:hypothetical protein